MHRKQGTGKRDEAETKVLPDRDFASYSGKAESCAVVPAEKRDDNGEAQIWQAVTREIGKSRS